MKYVGMPMGMWKVFHRSFQKNLVDVLKYNEEESRMITASAKKKYRELIEKLPEFEKADRYKRNEVNCVMVCAFFLNGSHLNGLIPNKQREKKLYRVIPLVGLTYKTFGKYRKENMEYFEQTEREVIAWING